MNRTLKMGIAALALAAVAPAFAQDAEEMEDTVGWTPVALGLATPVQLPWGIDRWDVYGLDFNLFYSDAPHMAGLDFGGFATLTRRSSKGLVLSLLCNGAMQDVYGVRITCGLNICPKTVKGAEIGMLAFRDTICGFDANFLGSAQHNICGLQIAGLANVTSTESYGCTVAGACNLARTAYGLQLAIFYNMTDELHGAQVGLVNYVDYCPNGFQIGLINIIRSNVWPVLPFVNGCF